MQVIKVTVFVCFCEHVSVCVCVCVINPLHHHYTHCLGTSHCRVLNELNYHMGTCANEQNQTSVIASNSTETLVGLYAVLTFVVC